VQFPRPVEIQNRRKRAGMSIKEELNSAHFFSVLVAVRGRRVEVIAEVCYFLDRSATAQAA